MDTAGKGNRSLAGLRIDMASPLYYNKHNDYSFIHSTKGCRFRSLEYMEGKFYVPL